MLLSLQSLLTAALLGQRALVAASVPIETIQPQPSTSIKPTPTPTFVVDPILDGPRQTNVLAGIKGLYPLPDPGTIITKSPLNTTNIQGDIIVGMQKQNETFYFFHINNSTSFKVKLHKYIVPRITSAFDLLATSTQPQVCVNLAFTYTGLKTLGFPTNLGDPVFGAGQAADASFLGDPGTQNWVPAFAGTEIDGVFLLATDTQVLMDAQVNMINTLFGSDITKVYSLQGNVRPGPEAGHEAFGYLDGIGQPAISGFNLSPRPGQEIVNPGVILTGEPGDGLASARPPWAFDGSFLVFRQLKQLVPEFNQFLLNNAPPISGFTQQQSADLLGARMIGRWKSGAPVDLNPTADNPPQGIDVNQNNNFNYAHAGFSLATDQSHCPFAAHIRKTRPRADQVAPNNSIMRAGIPYGPEVTAAESSSGISDPKLERGLAFAAYQSDIGQGFRFMQTKWANSPSFAPNHTPAPGFDPIIGQQGTSSRFMSGYDITNPNANLILKSEMVISRGGEYFFAPSISAIRDVLSV